MLYNISHRLDWNRGEAHEKERTTVMAANEKMVLFAVTLTPTVLILIIVSVWLCRRVVVRYLRRRMTPDLVLRKFCDGNVFDIERLLKSFGVDYRLGEVDYGVHSYSATLRGGRIRFVLVFASETCGKYFLRRIEYYCDANQQFQGWYTLYDEKMDRSSAKYHTCGVDISDHEASRNRLPSFRLTERAIGKLTTYLLTKSS